MKYYIKDNVIKEASDIIVYAGDRQIINPSEGDLLADGWIEYIPPKPIEKTEEERENEYLASLSYNEAVNYMVRKKYSESEEFALLRQRNTKPEEFQVYNDYCEECKTIIKSKFTY